MSILRVKQVLGCILCVNTLALKRDKVDIRLYKKVDIKCIGTAEFVPRRILQFSYGLMLFFLTEFTRELR